jgi:hypothetical protein
VSVNPAWQDGQAAQVVIYWSRFGVVVWVNRVWLDCHNVRAFDHYARVVQNVALAIEH